MASNAEPTLARPVRDCQHVRVHHEHGTRAAYVLDRCRCGPCGQANTLAERRRSKAIAYGTWSGLVDAHATRAHVQSLRANGLSLQRIVQLSDVGQGTLNALVYGEPSRRRPPAARVRADTERRLLAVRFDASAVPAGRRIDATGSRRRLQALAAVGWPVPLLATRSGLSVRTLQRALGSVTVTAQTARTISLLYDELHARAPAPRTSSEHARSVRTIARSRRAGWRGAVAWDDIDGHPDEALDAPADPPGDAPNDGAWEVLDTVAIERAMSGERLVLTPLERREAVARLTRRGLSARQIGELLHSSSRTVVRLRRSSRDTAA